MKPPPARIPGGADGAGNPDLRVYSFLLNTSPGWYGFLVASRGATTVARRGSRAGRAGFGSGTGEVR